MIEVCFKIVNIDYEKTFRQIFPILKEKLDALESKNMIIRLFRKLDDEALPVLLGIMDSLSESTKNELLVLCLNTYSVKLSEMLNKELTKHPYGKHLNLGKVSGIHEKEALYLRVEQIEVDYKGLVREKLSGKLGVFASAFVGEKLEKMALELLWTEDSKQKLIKLAESALDEHGFVMELKDIQIIQDIQEFKDVIEVDGQLKMTDEMEEDILDALAGYLKDKAAKQSNN